MSSNVYRRIAQDTLSICESGSYSAKSVSGSAVCVSISEQLAQAVARTTLYRSKNTLPPLPVSSRLSYTTLISVRNEDTLSGAYRLAQRYNLLSSDKGPAVLNFASALEPGGGFLQGALAQEECLARCSGLYKCLVKFQKEFYDEHLNSPIDDAHRYCLYSSSIIYSPGVPVFRSPNLSLLSQPYPVSFITCAALCMADAAWVGVDWTTAEKTMFERARRVLHMMHANGHRCIVLGAWGCGAFRNPPNAIAAIFSQLLGQGGEFEGVFEEIVFSVLDDSINLFRLSAFQVLDNTK